MSLKSRFRTIVAFVTTVCFSASSFAATTAPSGFVESLFHYARTNQVKKIRYLVHDMGYDIDSENEKGDTAYCIAKEKNNVYAMELLASFGANAKQRCGMPWGVIGTVAGVAAVGGIAAAAGGGGGGGSGNSCKDVVCGTNEHCSKGKCICDEGYGKYGTNQCHPTMACVHGSQYNDKCLCDRGYQGNFCDKCSFGYERAADGSCQAAECAGFDLTDIPANATWSSCQKGEEKGYKIESCDTGYVLSADGKSCEINQCEGYTLTSCPANASSCSECQSGAVTKYKADSCIEGYKGDECDSCALGYDVFDDEGGCYWNLHCENNTIGSEGTQTEDHCDCREGYDGTLCDICADDYTMDATGKCVETLDCGEHGTQVGNTCVCDKGYDGTKCDICADDYTMDATGKCVETLDCGEHGKQVGNTCVCDEGYGRDATGKCVAKSSGAYEPVSKEKANFVNEEIDITNSNYVDVIGKNYDESVKNPEAQIRGNQYDLYLSHVDLNAYVTTDQTIDHKATININNLSDGDVYALKTNEAKNIFLSFLSLDTNQYSKEGTESALINVTNGGKIEGTENFYTGGNGNVYGVYGGEDTKIYTMAQELTGGASVNNDKLDRTTEINITSIGSGNVYGIYGLGDIYNTLFKVDSFDDNNYYGTHDKTENAIINVESTGSGNVYGIYGDVGDVSNGGIINASSVDGDAHGVYTKSSLNNFGDVYSYSENKNAYGLYNGKTLENLLNSGNVDVSAEWYDAYGMYSGAIAVINRGNIDVEAFGEQGSAYGIYIEDYTENQIQDINNEDTGKIYVDSEGEAFGIYTSGNNTKNITNIGEIDVESVNGIATGIEVKNSIITNSGKIDVYSENASAYGIYGNNMISSTNGGSIDVTTENGDAYGIYGKEGSTINNTGTIMAKSDNGKTYGVALDNSMIRNNGTINVGFAPEDQTDPDNPDTPFGTGEVYGIKASNVSEITNTGTITAVTDDISNAYGIYGLNGSTINHQGSIAINSQGSISASDVNGGTYGIYLDNSNLTMASSSEISIEKNTGAGTIYGIYVKADDNDSYTKEIIAARDSSMTISRTSDGETYGIYDESGSVITYNGDMNITTALNHAYGAYLNGSKYNNGQYTNITVENTNAGNAYGFYNFGGETSIQHDGTMTVKTKEGIAYGVYVETPSENGISVTTSDINSKIEVESSGVYTAYGIKSDNGKVILGLVGGSTIAVPVGEINVKNTYEGDCDIEKEECAAFGIDSASVDIFRRSIIVNPTKGAAIGIKGTDDVEISDGFINVQSTDAPATGIIAKTGLFGEDSKLTVTSENSAAAGIMVLQNGPDGTYIVSDSDVSVTGNTDAKVYGIYAEGKFSMMDESSITVENKGTGEAHGVYSKGSGAVNVNGSTITVTNNGASIAYGIYSESSGDVTVTNSTINVTNNADGNAYGIYKETGTVKIDAGTKINVTTNIRENAYGIYAKNANVENYGEIILNGLSNKGGMQGLNFVVEIHDSVYTNLGLTSTSYALNFDDIDGTMALGKGGVYEALSLAGTMAVDSSVVEEGFDDTYVETESLKAETIDVNVTSQSAMFDAKVEKNTEKDSANVIMTRKSFAELSNSASIAEFLEQNYEAKNNSVLFSNLKKADTSSYAKTEAELLGYALLPNFAQENMSVLRNLNTTLTDELFTTKGAERKIVGYDHLYRARDTKGTLTGYENYANTMYFMYDVEGDNLIRKGFGMGITQFRSDYDDDSDRKDLMVQAFVPVSYINDKGMSFASIARFGYSDGEYERHTSDGMYESDLTSWIYGLSNAVRYGFDFGGLIVEPTAEFNVLGYYQNRIRENNNKAMSIKADAENNLSVEMGLGVNIRKDVKLNEHSSLSFNANAMYYHEFAKPYHSLEASMHGMDGKYVITDYENIYDRDRAMLSLGLDYNYKPFTFYGKFKQFIEDENPFEANAGIKYNF